MIEIEPLITTPFIQRSLVAGIIVGTLMAFLGVVVVLRHISFFSDAIGHSALTGIALGLLLDINPYLAAFVFSLAVAVSITLVRLKSHLALDTLLGVFFSAAVALGVILVQQTPGYQADLLSFLFGDILTISNMDVALAAGLSVITLITLLLAGKAFISITFEPTLAKAEGVPVERHELILMILLASTIALGIKLVGVILVTALLIIPAASAQNIARSLSSMFSISVLFSLISVIIGMLLSIQVNTPPGPTIIIVGTGLFALSLAAKPLLR